MKRDDYFEVHFDHFWNDWYFIIYKAAGAVVKIGWSLKTKQPKPNLACSNP
jgi:hypothetical protein